MCGGCTACSSLMRPLTLSSCNKQGQENDEEAPGVGDCTHCIENYFSIMFIFSTDLVCPSDDHLFLSLSITIYISLSLVNFDFYARLLHNNVHISGFIPRHLPHTLVRQLRQLTTYNCRCVRCWGPLSSCRRRWSTTSPSASTPTSGASGSSPTSCEST